MDRNLERIALSCVRECERQHVGLDRLAFLLEGYAYAVDHAADLPTEGDVLHLASVVEPTTGGRYRLTPVSFTAGGSSAAPATIAAAVARLFGLLDHSVDPSEFVHHFLAIHPFTDGNGRLGFLLWNWLLGTLEAPEALPEYEFT